MARKRQSDFETWVDVASRLPWWAALILAAISYTGFHFAAGAQIAKPVDVAGFGQFAGMQIWITLAKFLQYLVPAILVIGALVSAIKGKKRQRLHDAVQQRTDRAALFDMNWREFEQLVSEHFRRKGFSVGETGGGGADDGRDLVLRRGADKYLVQCKQWRSAKVGVEVVRELFGVMAADGAVGGYVVTCGAFTDEARRFADGRNVELIAGDQLMADIRGVAVAPSSKTEVVELPDCPNCRAPMVKRVAKQGPRTGQSFWGCSKYPTCKGTLPVS